MTSISFPAPKLFQPRSVALALVGSLVGLVSVVYLSNVPIRPMTASAEILPLRTPLAHPVFHHHPPTPVVVPPVVQSSSDESDLNRLALHSNRKAYMYTFTGTIACGNSPCKEAEVQISVETLRNRNIQKEAIVQPDGSYAISISLQEVPHEAIDWHVVAQARDTDISEFRGRQILMEDAAVTVDTPIQL